MASLVTHAALGALVGRTAFPGAGMRGWAVATFLSVAPDLDVVTFAFGVPYEHVLGHRGLTHSLLVAVAAGLLACLLTGLEPRGRAAAVFATVTASHGLLDAMTDGGLGVAFLAPFDDRRFFLPFRPIEVSPIGARAFVSARGLEVLASELLWVWLPVAAVVTIGWLAIRSRR